MNYKNKKILKIAQNNGYTTAKDFAHFIKKYREILEIYDTRGQLFS